VISDNRTSSAASTVTAIVLLCLIVVTVFYALSSLSIIDANVTYARHLPHACHCERPFSRQPDLRPLGATSPQNTGVRRVVPGARIPQ